MLNGAYLHILYAEDVRDEADDRTSILGCFDRGHVLRIAQQPIELKRFAVHGTLCVPDDVQLTSLQIAIKINDELVTKQDVSKLLQEPEDITHHNGERLNLRMFNFAFRIEDITLAKPSVFSVLAYVNDIEVRGNRFLITNEERA